MGVFHRPGEARGLNMAILIAASRPSSGRVRPSTGGSPPTVPQRPDPHSRSRFPGMLVGISLWETKRTRRPSGAGRLQHSRKNYEGDSHTYYLYTITPKQIGRRRRSSEDRRRGAEGTHAAPYQRRAGGGVPTGPRRPCGTSGGDGRNAGPLSPDGHFLPVLSRVICTGRMMGRPSMGRVPLRDGALDNRDPKPKRLIRFIRWPRISRRCTAAAPAPPGIAPSARTGPPT
jgi:hypothetical protein